jgi:hypothetical protein
MIFRPKSLNASQHITLIFKTNFYIEIIYGKKGWVYVVIFNKYVVIFNKYVVIFNKYVRFKYLI